MEVKDKFSPIGALYKNVIYCESQIHQIVIPQKEAVNQWLGQCTSPHGWPAQGRLSKVRILTLGGQAYSQVEEGYCRLERVKVFVRYTTLLFRGGDSEGVERGQELSSE